MPTNRTFAAFWLLQLAITASAGQSGQFHLETSGRSRLPMATFFAELKRRNVYKVAAAYAVVGWLLVQISTQVFPFFEIPNWAVRLIVLLIVIGFPIALVIAWAFELTPEGLKRTEDVDRDADRRRRPHAWIYIVTVATMLSIGLFFLGRYSGSRGTETPSGNSAIPAKSVAVLPLVNTSGDPNNEY